MSFKLPNYLMIFSLLLLYSCNRNETPKETDSIESTSKVLPDTSLLIASANLYYQSENYTQAAKEYEELIALDSTNGKFYFRQAYSYARLHNYEKAIPAYLKAADLAFEPYDCYYSVGIIYYTILFDDKKSRIYFEKCLEIDPNSQEAKDFLNKLSDKQRPMNL